MKLKKNINKIISKNNIFKQFLVLVYKYNRYSKNVLKTFVYAIKLFFKTSFFKRKKNVYNFKRINIPKLENNNFIYFIDPYRIVNLNKPIIDNMSIDYSKILDYSLNDLRNKVDNLNNIELKNDLYDSLDSLNILIDKTIVRINKDNIDEKYKIFYENIKNKKCSSFEEALQRILFYNQILYQSGHTLNGLGRLDKILNDYYNNDLKNKKLTKEQVKELIKKFLLSLHKYYWLKSSLLLGDTGQIIILGGNDKNKYFCNDLTYLFIEALMELDIPDPKILLRVSSKTPRDLLELSVKSISTGIGSPLLANDDVIIPKLIDFGYEKIDTYNYVTSACWEPLIVGNSIEQNNMDVLNFMKPFNEMLDSEDLTILNSVDDILNKYKIYLNKYVDSVFERVNNVEYAKDPFLSLVVDTCYVNNKDVLHGGSKYNNFGVTGVAIGNVVNSLLNIDKFVYKDKKYTLDYLNKERKNNFKNIDVLNDLKNQNIRYGEDSDIVINLTNRIIKFVNEYLDTKYNKKGGRLKFGVSAPSYISEAQNEVASLDGRKNGEPFIVHISSDAVSKSYTEIINFSSMINYSQYGFNGNVVDYIVDPNFINNNFDKFVDLIRISIKQGFFEMQMNVVNSDILIKAKKNPKLYPNLIVRVWGFSAYFNDLPNEYKDLLIERTLINEGKSY